MSFDETELKNKSDYTSNDKVKSFLENIMVIEEEWFSDMNLAGASTFPKVLIKRAKSIINLNIIFHVKQSDTYARLQ